MATRLYGLLWRWHFMAGLVVFPVLFVIAMTGAIYTFQPELDRLANPELLTVAPRPERRPLDELAAVAARTCTARGILVPYQTDRAVTVYCKDDREAYVDPYAGALLGIRDTKRSFFGIVFDLHYELMLGERGRQAVEWATSWALLLMISGVVLWWPRGGRRGGGVWWPRRDVGSRQRLRDLHAVAGAYFAPVLLALTATGLTWTLHAGDERWRPLTKDAVQRAWESPPRSTANADVPRIGYDAALAVVMQGRVAPRLAVYTAILSKPDEAYEFLIYDESFETPSASWSTWVDARTGSKLLEVGWHDHSMLGKIHETAYPIHVGALLGLPGRIAACVGSMLLAGLCVTGPWMWWKRRPRGELGVPPSKRRASWRLVLVLALVGWLLPLVGWTLIAIGLFEASRWLIRSKLRRQL